MPTFTREGFATLECLLDEALSLNAPQRAELLMRVLREDPAVHAELAALLALESVPGPLDQLPQKLPKHALDIHDGERAGVQIGNYRLDRLLGEGGMATVWSASRSDDAIAHQVAVKCLKSGLATPNLRARFLREQQILARLEHPNITRLYDVGIGTDGVPYIVMELVAGEAITRYCDRSRLDLRQRLLLFRGVLDAVAFAHQNLIIHRDLKPGNILVTVNGEPKLLDFGIAKPLGDDDAATHTDLRALTPDYAAPEQFSGAPITTGTDVYALGVVLHELLAGCRPSTHAVTNTFQFSRAAAIPASQTLLYLRRSDTHSDQAHPLDRAAQNRGFVNALRLARALRGDLDTLLLSALQVEPARRYASVVAFDQDIERFLNNEPLRARPPSRRYRFGKFLRRNWLAVGASVVVALALVIGTSVALWQAKEARRQAERANAVQDFMLGVFEAAQPGPRAETVLTTRELVERTAIQLRERFADQPDVSARVLLALGRVYRKMGLLNNAQPLLEQAVEIARRDAASDPLTLADALEAMGDWLQTGGSGYAQAVTTFQEALQLQRAHAARPARIAHTLVGLAKAQSDLGDPDAAEKSLVLAFIEIERDSDHDPALRFQALLVRATNARRAGRYDDAIAAAQSAVDIARTSFGGNSSNASHALTVLGTNLRQTGRFAEAASALREVTAIDRETAHQVQSTHLYFLGALELDAGDYTNAVATLREALDAARTTLGDDAVDLGSYEELLARALLELDRVDGAEPLARSALDRYEASPSEAGGELNQMRLTLADALAAGKDADRAEPLYRQVLDATAEPRSARARNQKLFAVIGIALVASRKHDALAAKAAVVLAISALSSAAKADLLPRLRGTLLISSILLSIGDAAASEAQASAALQLASTGLPADHPLTARARLASGEALLALNRADAAKPFLSAALPVLAAKLPPAHRDLLRARALADKLATNR